MNCASMGSPKAVPVPCVSKPQNLAASKAGIVWQWKMAAESGPNLSVDQCWNS